MICPKCGEEASEWEITSRRGSHAQGFCMAEIVASYSQAPVIVQGPVKAEEINTIKFGVFTAYPDADCDRGKITVYNYGRMFFHPDDSEHISNMLLSGRMELAFTVPSDAMVSGKRDPAKSIGEDVQSS